MFADASDVSDFPYFSVCFFHFIFVPGFAFFVSDFTCVSFSNFPFCFIFAGSETFEVFGFVCVFLFFRFF